MSLEFDWVVTFSVDGSGEPVFVRWVPAAPFARSVIAVNALLNSLLSDGG
jgi:hypothetical protein